MLLDVLQLLSKCDKQIKEIIESLKLATKLHLNNLVPSLTEYTDVDSHLFPAATFLTPLQGMQLYLARKEPLPTKI